MALLVCLLPLSTVFGDLVMRRHECSELSMLREHLDEGSDSDEVEDTLRELLPYESTAAYQVEDPTNSTKFTAGRSEASISCAEMPMRTNRWSKFHGAAATSTAIANASPEVGGPGVV